MKNIHAQLRKQIKYAKDIEVHSVLACVFFVVMILFSYFTDQIYTQQRNLGRDIRTTQYKLINQVYLLQSHVCFGSLNNTDAIQSDIALIQGYHTYLSNNSINKNALTLFFKGDKDLAQIIFIATNQVVLCSNQSQFVSLITSYEKILGSVYIMYTTILAANNANISVYDLSATTAELFLLVIILFVIIRPVLHKFMKASERFIDEQTRALQIQEQMQQTIDQLHVDMLPSDVFCIGANVYVIVRDGIQHKVLYNEKFHAFYCKCNLFLQYRTCPDIEKAKALHTRIYKCTKND